MRRVAITGIGILSALGRGKAQHLDAVVSSRSGIRSITRWPAGELGCRIAGEIPDPLEDLSREVDRVTGLALLAAEEAAAQAGLPDWTPAPESIATIIGTGLGGSETLDAGYERLYGRGQSRLHPMTIPRIMYNAPTSAVAARWGAKGPAFATVSACASSTHAIGQAAHWIRMGLADVALAGGSDAPITVGILRCWEALRVLAIDNESPGQASRPFSADRKGIVLAEGSAVLVLETFDSALGRGADILGEIAGFGMSSDAGHMTDPAAEGEERAMRMALRDAGIGPEAIGYINAHGTGTRANDRIETEAIRSLFEAGANALPVSSTKSMHGHAMGASGAIEAALSLIALNDGWLPPTLNLTAPDPECDLDYVPLRPRRARVETFLSNSFGFGGLNAVLAIRTREGVRASG